MSHVIKISYDDQNETTYEIIPVDSRSFDKLTKEYGYHDLYGIGNSDFDRKVNTELYKKVSDGIIQLYCGYNPFEFIITKDNTIYVERTYSIYANLNSAKIHNRHNNVLLEGVDGENVWLSLEGTTQTKKYRNAIETLEELKNGYIKELQALENKNKEILNKFNIVLPDYYDIDSVVILSPDNYESIKESCTGSLISLIDTRNPHMSHRKNGLVGTDHFYIGSTLFVKTYKTEDYIKITVEL
jgi:hypothetical protein